MLALVGLGQAFFPPPTSSVTQVVGETAVQFWSLSAFGFALTSLAGMWSPDKLIGAFIELVGRFGLSGLFLAYFSFSFYSYYPEAPAPLPVFLVLALTFSSAIRVLQLLATIHLVRIRVNERLVEDGE